MQWNTPSVPWIISTTPSLCFASNWGFTNTESIASFMADNKSFNLPNTMLILKIHFCLNTESLYNTKYCKLNSGRGTVNGVKVETMLIFSL